MLRALIGACAIWFAAVSEADSCYAPSFFKGIVFESVPPDTPRNALILEVDFTPDAVRREYTNDPRVATARVLRVVRGSYELGTVRVALGDSTCDYPWVFGARGLIIGYLRTPEEAQAAQQRARDRGGIFRWPHRETVFVPFAETVVSRDQRTGAESNP
jgi:hypothetical protein